MFGTAGCTSQSMPALVMKSNGMLGVSPATGSGVSLDPGPIASLALNGLMRQENAEGNLPWQHRRRKIVSPSAT
jgi:hypothetical protein